MRFLKNITPVIRDRRGISAVEYAIMLGVVGAVLAGAFTTVGTQVQTYVSTAMTKIVGGGTK